jgi:ribonuclease P protein component
VLKKPKQYRWFHIKGGSVRVSAVSASWVDVDADRKLRWPLIVSLPKPCGTAVTRNKFRRLCRSYFSDLSRKEGWNSERKVLWIRLDRRHRLEKKVTLQQWQPVFEKLLGKLPSVAASHSPPTPFTKS